MDPGFGESIPDENDGQQPDAAFENVGQQSSDSDDAAFENDDQVHDPNDDQVHDAPVDDPLDAPDAPADDPLDVDGYVNPAMISPVFIFHLS